MTRNQIEYLKLREQQRVNQMTAIETKRNHVMTERETKRANVAREQENVRSNQAREAETTRSNRASEYRTVLNLQEQGRHNRSTEDLSRRDLDERARHNLATETETARANKAGEFLQSQRNVLNAQANAEIARHQLASEGLTAAGQYYSYLVGTQNAESTRRQAAVSEQQVDVARRNADTLARNAATNETNANTNLLNALTRQEQTQIQQYLATETNRHNLATELAAQQRISLDRANLIVDSIFRGLSMLQNSNISSKDISYSIWRLTHGKVN